MALIQHKGSMNKTLHEFFTRAERGCNFHPKVKIEVVILIYYF